MLVFCLVCLTLVPTDRLKAFSSCCGFLLLDVREFRQRHPITTYEHYRELIGRIATGEKNVIIPEVPLILAMTSGTSGPSAMLLSTRDTNTEFFLQVPPLHLH